MESKQLLQAACALTGDPVEAVLSHRLTGDSLIMVVDRGIAGCPKFEFSFPELTPEPEPEPPFLSPPTPQIKRGRKK